MTIAFAISECPFEVHEVVVDMGFIWNYGDRITNYGDSTFNYLSYAELRWNYGNYGDSAFNYLSYAARITVTELR